MLIALLQWLIEWLTGLNAIGKFKMKKIWMSIHLLLPVQSVSSFARSGIGTKALKLIAVWQLAMVVDYKVSISSEILAKINKEALLSILQTGLNKMYIKDNKDDSL